MYKFHSLQIAIFSASKGKSPCQKAGLSAVVAFGAALFLGQCGLAQADAPFQPPTLPLVHSIPTPSTPLLDAHKALQLVLARDACSLPLDLKAEGTTVEELAPRIQKKLAASSNPSIKRLRVEVRGVRPIRLTFDAKGSTVGGILNSIAFLSSSQLWILPDYLLIAPQEALTAEEQETNKFGLQSSEGAISRLPIEVIAAFTTFIGTQIRGLPGSATFRSAFPVELTTDTKITAAATFDQLSPDAQAMLQALVQSSNSTTFTDSTNYHFARMELIPSAFVGVNNDSQRDNLSVQVPPTGTPSIFQFQWAFSGGGSGASAGGGTPSPKSQPPHPTPSLVDPSAGKSE